MSNLKPHICNTNIYSQPVCTPNNNTIWYINTWNFVTWDITNILYFNYDKLSLYFYYQENYKFYKTVNFTNIGSNDGYYSLLINNSFLPKCEKNKNWNYSLLLVGDNVNPDDEITDKLSKWKRVDFNIIQNISCSDNNNNTITNSSNIQSESNKNGTKNIEIWKIIVIVICCILLCLITIILIRLMYIKKIIIRKNKNYNEKNHNEVNCEILKETIYQKPEIKESIKKFNYNKPNEIINYEKPNSY